MKKKNYIFVLTFLCLLCGQMGYAQDAYSGEVEHFDTLTINGVEYNIDVTVYNNADDFMSDHPDLNLELVQETISYNNGDYVIHLCDGGTECSANHSMEAMEDILELEGDISSRLHLVVIYNWELNNTDYVDNGDCTDYRSSAYPCEYVDNGDCSDSRSTAYPCDSYNPCDPSSSVYDLCVCDPTYCEDNSNDTPVDNTNTTPVLKNWYLDNDGDGYDSGKQQAAESSGTGWLEGDSKGSDCDDAKYSLENSCCTQPCTATQLTTSRIASTTDGQKMCPCENTELIKMNTYLINNPNVSISQYENWFLTPREGVDGEYDNVYWDDPNLTFPPQSLPTFEAFNNAYPRIDGIDLANLVGGEVISLYNNYPSVVRGFCALKVSRALNYSGVIIPEIKTTQNSPGTVKGSDGMYYFLNAKALNKWMQKTFGVSPQNPNHIRILGTEGGVDGRNFPSKIEGIKGIYSMVSYIPNWASGHADLINNNTCVFGCHFYDNPPAPIDYIDIWKLN